MIKIQTNDLFSENKNIIDPYQLIPTNDQI
jgi:hypothetical protein